MDALAPEVAQKFGFAETDYIGVLKRLKQQTIPNDQIEEYYRNLNEKIEEKVREGRIATLPDYPLQMRLATTAEAAAQPAPHMSPPRLIGNTGEQGQFILTAGNLMQTDQLLAGVVILSLLGLIIGTGLTRLERWVLRWR